MVLVYVLWIKCENGGCVVYVLCGVYAIRRFFDGDVFGVVYVDVVECVVVMFGILKYFLFGIFEVG